MKAWRLECEINITIELKKAQCFRDIDEYKLDCFDINALVVLVMHHCYWFGKKHLALWQTGFTVYWYTGNGTVNTLIHQQPGGAQKVQSYLVYSHTEWLNKDLVNTGVQIPHLQPDNSLSVIKSCSSSCWLLLNMQQYTSQCFFFFL